MSLACVVKEGEFDVISFLKFVYASGKDQSELRRRAYYERGRFLITEV